MILADSCVAPVWEATGYITRALLICMLGERCGVWMMTKIRSREIHNRLHQMCSNIVGLLANSGRCKDDAGLKGLFCEPSLPMLHRSSEDGST